MGIPNEEAVAMPPMLDLALMEPTHDILLHVQYTININVPYFHVRNRELDSNRNVVESNVDVVNPFVPVHLRVIEGDPYQQYTVEFSSNPLWVTGDRLFGSTTDRTPWLSWTRILRKANNHGRKRTELAGDRTGSGPGRQEV